MIYTGEPYLKK